MKTTRLLALGFVMILFSVACGQKPGVHIAGSGGSSGSGGQLSGEGPLAAGETVLDAEGNPVASGGSTSGNGGSTGSTSTGKTAGPSNSVGISANPNDRVGVSKTGIKVGFHAPFTGAAAVDLNDLKFGVNTYRDWLKDKGGSIHGRQVDVQFRDDQYSPSIAVSVCRELVEKQQVFLLIGGAGTDQIQACGRYANQKKVPYLSAGVTEKILSGLPNYLAFYETYPDQTPELAKLIRNFDAGPGKGGKVFLDRCSSGSTAACSDALPGSTEPKVAVVYSNTEGFYDARDEFLKAMGPLVGGTDKIVQKAITKFTIGASEANSVVTELKGAGVDVVFIITSPTNFGNILTPAQGQAYAPRWVGLGLTFGINLVAIPACGRQRTSYEFSIMFHPSPSVYHPVANQWKQAWAEFGGPDPSDRSTPDQHDIAFALWGGSIVQHILFNAAGPDLTRSGFLAAAQKLKNAVAVDSTPAGDVVDVYTPMTFSPTDKFGGESMHIVWADCTKPGYNFFEKNGKLLTTADL